MSGASRFESPGHSPDKEEPVDDKVEVEKEMTLVDTALEILKDY